MLVRVVWCPRWTALLLCCAPATLCGCHFELHLRGNPLLYSAALIYVLSGLRPICRNIASGIAPIKVYKPTLVNLPSGLDYDNLLPRRPMPQVSLALIEIYTPALLATDDVLDAFQLVRGKTQEMYHWNQL